MRLLPSLSSLVFMLSLASSVKGKAKGRPLSLTAREVRLHLLAEARAGSNQVPTLHFLPYLFLPQSSLPRTWVVGTKHEK